MPSILPPQLRKLASRQAATTVSLVRYLLRAQAGIMARISWYAAKKDIAARAITREQLFDEIEASYSELGTGITRQIENLLGTVAKDAHAEASEETGGLLRYDPERIRRYFDLVRPGTSKNLAATFTDSMAKDAVRRLRWAFVDTFRRATVEGLTATETHRALQDRWNVLAGDENNFRFVDAAGRRWENARYLQMLVRTNSARVHRESHIDSLIGMGFTLASVSTDGGEENCSVCDRWEGRVIRIGGEGDGFPTYEEALADGLFHPNCTHRLEYVDETVHKDLIDKWRGQPKPGKDTGSEGGALKVKGMRDSREGSQEKKPQIREGTADAEARRDVSKTRPLSQVGNVGNWKSLGLGMGETANADPQAPSITAKSARARIVAGEQVNSPLGEILSFDAVTLKHLEKANRKASEINKRLSEMEQAKYAVETPHEIWEDLKTGRKKYIRFVTGKKGNIVVNVVDDNGSHVYSWHTNERSLDHWRAGKLVYSR